MTNQTAINLLRTAANEIKWMQKQIEILSAQVRVISVFEAALGLRQDHGTMSVDTVWRIEEEIKQIENETSTDTSTS